MPKTATEMRLADDGDHVAAKRFADVMIGMLRDYIPEHSRRDAWDALAKAAFEQGFDLTSKAMRKEYEAWRSTQIEMLNLATSAPAPNVRTE
jgi:hypothetical protein